MLIYSPFFNSIIELSDDIALYHKERELTLSNEDWEYPCLMGCDVIYYGINVQIFRKDLLPQFSGENNEVNQRRQ